jgi:hypothetical protein
MKAIDQNYVPAALSRRKETPVWVGGGGFEHGEEEKCLNPCHHNKVILIRSTLMGNIFIGCLILWRP